MTRNLQPSDFPPRYPFVPTPEERRLLIALEESVNVYPLPDGFRLYLVEVVPDKPWRREGSQVALVKGNLTWCKLTRWEGLCDALRAWPADVVADEILQFLIWKLRTRTPA